MSLFAFFLFSLLLPAFAASRHVIPLPYPDLRPSSVAWDPSAQHFIVGSSHRPLVSSVSDAGVVQPLVSYDSASSSSVSVLAVDDPRRRLIAAFSSPPVISAFDLRSTVPYRPIFSSPLPAPAVGAAVDLATGAAFVATASGQILTVDLDGKIKTLADVGGEIGGVAHVSNGYLLVAEKEKGGIFKVDAEDGAAKRVLTCSSVPSPAAALAVRSDGGAVVVGGAGARWVKSGDGWAGAAAYDEFRVGEGERIEGVTIRGGRKVYALVVREEGYTGGESGVRIEEVEWGREREGDDMVWAMVLLGCGLAYFMFWMFQMGKLVTSINKKRA